MFRVLLKKVWFESALLLSASALMIFAFCWTRVWIITRFELHRFQSFLDQLRQFEQFIPVPLEQFLTYEGSLALTFDEPVLIVCVLVWSISRGSDVVSGELGRGTLEMLLAQPIQRWQILLSHALISILGLAFLCTVAWLGLAAGIATNSVQETIANEIRIPIPYANIQLPIPIGSPTVVWTPLTDRVTPWLFVSPAANLFGFGLFILSLATLVSSWDRYRWRSIGLVVSFYIIQLLLFLLAKATPETEFCYGLTFFTLYQPDAIVHLLISNSAEAWSL